jgi:microcystin-dependent protein
LATGLANPVTISITDSASGVLLGSGSFNGSSNTNIPFTLNRSGVAAGTYTAPTITIQSDGRITSATSGGSVGAGQIINALGYTPANDALVVHIAGDTMTGTLTISGANLNVLSPGSIMQDNNTLLPSGCIVMWNGSSAPAGWQLCDGTNGTPDLRGSFIVSQGGPNGYSVGQTGGADFISTTTGAAGAHTHTMDVQGSHNHGGSDGSTVLDITMIPSHTHGFGTSQNVKTGTQTSYASGGDNSVWDNPSPALTGATGGGLGHNHSISTDGSHQHNITAVGDHTHSVSFDNRPAFYVLAYIMKL